jgi:hypothetical protein
MIWSADCDAKCHLHSTKMCHNSPVRSEKCSSENVEDIHVLYFPKMCSLWKS